MNNDEKKYFETEDYVAIPIELEEKKIVTTKEEANHLEMGDYVAIPIEEIEDRKFLNSDFSNPIAVFIKNWINMPEETITYTSGTGFTTREITPEEQKQAREALVSFGLGALEFPLSRLTNIYQDPEIQQILKEHPIAKGAGDLIRDLLLLKGLGKIFKGIATMPQISKITDLLSKGTILGKLSKTTKFGKQFLNFYELDRYTRTAIHGSITFGAWQALKEAGIYRPNQNLLNSIVNIGLTATFGAGRGIISAVPDFSTRVISAGVYGAGTTLLSGGDASTALFNGALMAGFEIIAGKDVDKAIKLQAFNNIKEEGYNYLIKKGMNPFDARRIIETATYNTIKKAGGLDNILENNSATNMNYFASVIKEIIPSWQFSAPPQIPFMPKGGFEEEKVITPTSPAISPKKPSLQVAPVTKTKEIDIKNIEKQIKQATTFEEINQLAQELSNNLTEENQQQIAKLVDKIEQRQEEINKEIPQQSIVKEIEEKTNLPFEKISKSEIENFIEGKIIPYNEENKQILDKISKKIKAIDLFSSDYYIFKGAGQNIFTNGFILINDKEIVKKLNEEVYNAIYKKEMKYAIKYGKTNPKEFALQEIEKLKSEAENNPISEETLKNLLEKNYNKEEAKIIGFISEKSGEKKLFLYDGKTYAIVNVDYFNFIKDNLKDDFSIRLSGQDEPVYFVKDNKIKALLMPIKVDKKNIPKILKEIKPKVTPSPSPSIQELIVKIKNTQQEKLLSNVTISRIKKYFGVENLKKASIPQLQKIADYLDTLKEGDKLLSEKQLDALYEMIKDIPDYPIIPKRVIIDKFGEKEDLFVKGITGKIINELLPTVDIKEGHPLITKIVNKATELLDIANNNIMERDKKLNEMLKKAEKSRKLPIGERIKRFLAPQNTEIFKALSGEKIELTKEEKAVVAYLKNFFKKVRKDLALEKYRKHYITHLEKPLMEKIVTEGIVKAIKDIFHLKPKEETIPIDILLELDNIIGSEKFFRFALERKGGIHPSTNLRHIIHIYSSLYETKKAIDQILPEGQAITQLLLKPKSAIWMKTFLQNLKGRGLDWRFRTGKMAWLAKLADTIIDVEYLKLLGLNYKSALKNILAGEANNFIWLGIDKYLTGKKRFLSNPKKAIKMAIDYGVLEGTYADYALQGINIVKQLGDIALIGQKWGEYEIRATLFISELTDEEWKAGKILNEEKIRQIKDEIAITQGIFSKTESPLWLQTWYGRLIMQMNRWSITDAMLVRRIILNAKEEIKQGKKFGVNMWRLIRMFFTYGVGMYFYYQLYKAGYKTMAKIVRSMAETLNNIIELITLKPIVEMIRDNPTIKDLASFAYTIQELTFYLSPAIFEKPKKIEVKKGIKETYIAPKETIEDVIDLFE